MKNTISKLWGYFLVCNVLMVNISAFYAYGIEELTKSIRKLFTNFFEKLANYKSA